MRILEEFGEITLQKFIFIASSRIENLADYDKYYDANLNGYYIEWPYHYNKNTHETDSGNFAHADIIDNLPFELQKAFRHNEGSGWGRTDWHTSGIRSFISDGISDSNKAVISNRLVRRN